MTDRARGGAGFTYVEMLISIVVIAIAVTGVLSVMNLTTGRSADPMIRQQAVAVAEAYLEEISLKAFADPGDTETGGSEGTESRPTFDDIFDYNDLPDQVVRNQDGTEITELARYQVRVTVTPDALDNVPGDGDYDDADGAARIDVQVTHTDMVDITLSGYRTDY